MRISYAVLNNNAYFLAKCADVGNASVYQEVVETMTGSDLWVTFTRIMIAIYAFSSCVAYLVLVGDQARFLYIYSVFISVFAHSCLKLDSFCLTGILASLGSRKAPIETIKDLCF